MMGECYHLFYNIVFGCRLSVESLYNRSHYAHSIHLSKNYHEKGINFCLLENLLWQNFLIPHEDREIAHECFKCNCTFFF